MFGVPGDVFKMLFHRNKRKGYFQHFFSRLRSLLFMIVGQAPKRATGLANHSILPFGYGDILYDAGYHGISPTSPTRSVFPGRARLRCRPGRPSRGDLEPMGIVADVPATTASPGSTALSSRARRHRSPNGPDFLGARPVCKLLHLFAARLRCRRTADCSGPSSGMRSSWAS